MSLLDNQLNEYLDSIEERHECHECGKRIPINDIYCSLMCFNASLI